MTTYRPWKLLNVNLFRVSLLKSPICDSQAWTSLTVDEMACLYDATVTKIIDKLIPFRTIRCPRRPSDPWFDDECRLAKRSARQLERSYRRTLSSDPAQAQDALDAWKSHLRRYRSLLKQKRSSFWHTKLESERHNARLLWRSFDVLMGRGRVPPAASISADAFLEFFLAKVSAARLDLTDTDPPKFSASPPNCSLYRTFILYQ